MNSLVRILTVCSILALAACGSDKVVVDTKPVQLNFTMPDIPQMQLTDTQIKILTPDNIKLLEADMAKNPQAYWYVDLANFNALVGNLKEQTRFIAQQRELIKAMEHLLSQGDQSTTPAPASK